MEWKSKPFTKSYKKMAKVAGSEERQNNFQKPTRSDSFEKGTVNHEQCDDNMDEKETNMKQFIIYN